MEYLWGLKVNKCLQHQLYTLHNDPSISANYNHQQELLTANLQMIHIVSCFTAHYLIPPNIRYHACKPVSCFTARASLTDVRVPTVQIWAHSCRAGELHTPALPARHSYHLHFYVQPQICKSTHASGGKRQCVKLRRSTAYYKKRANID